MESLALLAALIVSLTVLGGPISLSTNFSATAPTTTCSDKDFGLSYRINCNIYWSNANY